MIIDSHAENHQYSAFMKISYCHSIWPQPFSFFSSLFSIYVQLLYSNTIFNKIFTYVGNVTVISGVFSVKCCPIFCFKASLSVTPKFLYHSSPFPRHICNPAPLPPPPTAFFFLLYNKHLIFLCSSSSTSRGRGVSRSRGRGSTLPKWQALSATSTLLTLSTGQRCWTY